MANNPTPWFQLWASEFLYENPETKYLTLEDRGALLTLWCLMWTNPYKRGHLLLSKNHPIADEQIAKDLQISLENFQQIKEKLLDKKLIRIGKFGELFSRRQSKFKTKWELYGKQDDSKKKPKRKTAERKRTTELELESESEKDNPPSLSRVSLSPPNGKSKRDEKPENPQAKKLSRLLHDLILKNKKDFKFAQTWESEWSKATELMIRIDERDPQEMEQVLTWCQDDEFWKVNILSMKKFREQYDKLVLKMRSTGQRRAPPSRPEAYGESGIYKPKLKEQKVG